MHFIWLHYPDTDFKELESSEIRDKLRVALNNVFKYVKGRNDFNESIQRLIENK